MKITGVESFRVEVPLTDEQQKTQDDEQQKKQTYYNSSGITQVRTDEGITGYGFNVCDAEATWVEEPFARGEVELPARLRQEVVIPITGGEHQPYSIYPQYIGGGSYDIVQPHCANLFRHLKAVADMAEAFGMECIFHGSHGMDLIGSLQVGATIRTCYKQELVYTTPPMMPEDAWSPLNALVKGEKLYTVKDGYIQVPQAPGLGVGLDEEAIEKFRVE